MGGWRSAGGGASRAAADPGLPAAVPFTWASLAVCSGSMTSAAGGAAGGMLAARRSLRPGIARPGAGCPHGPQPGHTPDPGDVAAAGRRFTSR
jgi:hypothetical protein